MHYLKKRTNEVNKLSELLYDNISSNVVEIIKLVSIWEEIVGDTISNNSIPLKISTNILTLGVFDNIWLQELSFLKSDIINRLQTKDIFVKEIRFLLCTRKKMIKKITKHKSLKSEDKNIIEKISENIMDTSLKENYKRAFSAYFINKGN